MVGQGTSHCQTANMAAPVVGAENCQTCPHCDFLTTAEQAVVGMLNCGVKEKLLRLLSKHISNSEFVP